MPKKKKESLIEEEAPPTPPIAPEPIIEIVAPTELEIIESEMREISPTLHGLKRNNREKYEKVYRRYMQLVLRRDEILKGNP